MLKTNHRQGLTGAWCLGLAVAVVGALTVALPPGHAAAPLSAAKRAKLDAVLNRIKPNGPGASVAVVQNGQVVYQANRGMANIAKRQPITSQTVFDLASCSKQFTAMATMMAAERGALSLRDDVRKFVPELPASKSGITVTHLLNMTSGLAIYTDVLDDFEGVDAAEVARKMGKETAMFRPGKRHEYNNTDYVLLALIVQRATKKSFASFVNDSIFKPLGMTRSMVLDDADRKVPGRAQGYTPDGKGFEAVQDDTDLVGDGQVFSTTDDLVKWDRALTRNSLVKPQMAKLAFTPGKLANGDEGDYGFGWFVAQDDETHYVSHEGNWTGTNSYISRDLNAGLTVIVLCNNDKGGASTIGEKLEAAME
jgi:CubicO group peptidase (beta-lactamase class C family)